MLSVTEIVKQFQQNWTEELNSDNIANACRDSGMTWINSRLNPAAKVQIFLLQILYGNISCTHLSHLTRMAFTAAADCTARVRIKLEVFQLLLQRCVELA